MNVQLETTLKQNENDLILAQDNTRIFKSNVEQLELLLNDQKLQNNSLQAQVSIKKKQLNSFLIFFFKLKIDEYIAHEKTETKNVLAIKSRNRELENELEAANAKISELSVLNETGLHKQRAADVEQGNLLYENENLKLRILELDIKIKEVLLQMFFFIFD